MKFLLLLTSAMPCLAVDRCSLVLTTSICAYHTSYRVLRAECAIDIVDKEAAIAIDRC